jgi:hypothetical protein
VLKRLSFLKKAINTKTVKINAVASKKTIIAAKIEHGTRIMDNAIMANMMVAIAPAIKQQANFKIALQAGEIQSHSLPQGSCPKNPQTTKMMMAMSKMIIATTNIKGTAAAINGNIAKKNRAATIAPRIMLTVKSKAHKKSLLQLSFPVI